MNNNIYEQDNEMILVWPFYRYDVLIPEQIRGDLFVWLYLSLIVFKNGENKLEKDSYTNEVIHSVKEILKSKFSSVISSGEDSNLDRIIFNAESNYVNMNDENHKFLLPETFDFIVSYNELFSDKLQVKHIYQDAITGSVLPYFGEDIIIDESENPRNSIRIENVVAKPSKSAIKRAYKDFESIKKNNKPQEENTEEEQENFEGFDDRFDNPDGSEAAFFEQLDDFEEETPKQEKKTKSIDLDSFRVIYLDNTQVLMNYDVKVRVEDNMVVVDSPFDKRTNYWMTKCYNKGKNINSDLENRVKLFEDSHILKKIDSDEGFKFTPRQDLADSLYACGPLYRLVESLNNKDLSKIVLKLDTHLKNKNDEEFFPQLGKFLECIIEPFELTDMTQREHYSYPFYCNEVKQSCSNIDYTRLLKQNIFNDWIKGWQAFKAEFADLIVFTSLSDVSNMYNEFVEDVFTLYDLRNQYSHYNNETKIPASKKYIDLLLKITKVFAEIY